MWPRERTGGRRSTGSTRHTSSAWRSNVPRPGRCSTRSAKRECGCDIAEVISRSLDIPSASIAPDAAVAHFGHLGAFVGVDCPASAEITRQSLGWDPAGPNLLEDLEAGYYEH